MHRIGHNITTLMRFTENYKHEREKNITTIPFSGP